MHRAEEKLSVRPELFKALRLALRLAVAYADKRYHRRNIHHCQRLGIVGAYLSGGYEAAEYRRVIIDQPFDVSVGICLLYTSDAADAPSLEMKIVPAEYFGVVERFSVFAATGFNAALGIQLFCMKE